MVEALFNFLFFGSKSTRKERRKQEEIKLRGTFSLSMDERRSWGKFEKGVLLDKSLEVA